MYGNPQFSFRFEEVDECLVLRKPSGWQIDDTPVPASPAAMRPRGNMGRFVEPWGSTLAGWWFGTFFCFSIYWE